jgi:engulfment and cell motility protein 1
MSILAAVVSHPTPGPSNEDAPSTFGFRALKPAIAEFPQFLEMLVNRLSSADHALCANALQLINALMRDAITHGSDSEWPKFIKRLQDLGVIRAVYGLMQGSALQDVAQPLLEFQALTKILVRKWRDVPVDLDKSEHRRAVKGIHISSLSDADADEKTNNGKGKKSLAPDWKKIGFSGEGPGEEFEDVGFLGMMDLTDYVRKNETAFQRLLLEQAAQAEEKRCPISRASIAVTSILFEHFDIEKAELEDAKEYLALDSRESIDKLFKPMLLQWSKVHTAGLNAYLRIWKATGATVEDFAKISELLRILLEAVLGGTPRTKDVHAVEEEIQNYSYQQLREVQMELLELSYEDTWGQHLGHVREELKQEAMSFIKEQRIRCLLAGAWFSKLQWVVVADGTVRDLERPWGYVKLSHNRRYLHYGGFDNKGSHDLTLDELPQKCKFFLRGLVSSLIISSGSFECFFGRLQCHRDCDIAKLQWFHTAPKVQTCTAYFHQWARHCLCTHADYQWHSTSW